MDDKEAELWQIGKTQTGRDLGSRSGATPGKDSISKYTVWKQVVYMKDTVCLGTKNWGTQRKIKG